MDTIAYLHTLTREFEAVKDRVRLLIGNAHWPSEGGWKESVLRSVLRRHLPPNLQVGTGFVLSPEGLSRQVDVLLFDDRGPILFRDGDFVIVTPDVVAGIIEVKTRVTNGDVKEFLAKLNSSADLLRTQSRHPAPFIGLFSYEEEKIDVKYLLETLREVNGRLGNYEINCLSLGPRLFVRFWRFPPIEPKRHYNKWHAYDLVNIAPGYFIHNVLDHLFPESVLRNQEVWYPVDGKESKLIAELGKQEPQPSGA
jgi:hypothetical protein